MNNNKNIKDIHVILLLKIKKYILELPDEQLIECLMLNSSLVGSSLMTGFELSFDRIDLIRLQL